MFWVHRLDSNAEKGEINKIFFNAWLFPQLTCLAINGFPAFILMFLGGDFFTELLGRIPESFVNALSVTGNILPAVGVAMLLNYLGKKKVFPFFVIGFFLATYLNLQIMPIAIFGTCLALLSYYGGQGNENLTETSWAAEETDTEGDSKEKSGKEGLSVRLRRSDLIKHWLIGLGAEVGYNYERMQACFLQALFPQKCRVTSSKLHGEFPQYCISPSGTLLGAGEEPLQAYKVY